MANLGWIAILSSRVNLIFQDFSVKNVNITNQYGFASISSSRDDTATDLSAVQVFNGLVDGFYESLTVPYSGNTKALFINSGGPSILMIDNLVVRNVKLDSKEFA